MANNPYSNNGQDWYNRRLENIASMMSMQNTDPMYQLGALISDYYLKPRLVNWVSSQFGKKENTPGEQMPKTDKQTDVTIAAYSPNQQDQTGFYNQQDDPTAGLKTEAERKDELLHQPITTGDAMSNIKRTAMDLNRDDYRADAGHIQELNDIDYSNQPTQAEANEAANNQVNQQVTNIARNNATTLDSMSKLGAQGNVGSASGTIQAMQNNQVANNMSAAQAEEERNKKQIGTAIPYFRGGMPLSFDNAPKSSDEGSGANSTTTSSTTTDNNSTDTTNNATTNNYQPNNSDAVITAINRYVDQSAGNPLGVYGNYQTSSSQSADGTFAGRDMKQMITQKIIDYKKAYDVASAAGDTAGMQAAADGAEQMREIARANGISLSGIHKGNTLSDAQKKLDEALNGTSEEDAKNQLLTALYNTKQAYAVAEQQKDQAGMDKASAEANLLREIAKSNGIDVTDAGSDVSMAELNQTLQEAALKQAQEEQEADKKRLAGLTTEELLENPEPNISPDDFYQRTYSAIKKSNLPEWMARQMASDYSEQYRAKYLNNIANGFAETGVNADGTINQIGELFIAKAIQAGAPEMAQALINQYASPRDMWGFARDVDKANIKQAFTQQNLNTKYVQNQNLLKQKTDYQMQIDGNRANLDLQKQAQLKQLEHQLQGQDEITKAAARQQVVQQMKEQGYSFTPEEERNYITSGKYGGGSSGGSGGSGGSKSDDKVPSWAGKFNALYETARGSLDAADIDKLKDLYNEHVMEMDEKTKTFMYSQCLAVNFLAEKDHGSENKALEYASGIPKYLREVLLPGYDFSALDD